LPFPPHPSRKTASSYRELDERRQRLQKLERLYGDMALQKELKVLHHFYFEILVCSGFTFEGFN
jgi:U3 small nucleolar RNA-associated protein 11